MNDEQKETLHRDLRAALVAGPARVTVADPPWQFGDRGTRLAPDYSGPQRWDSRYQVMTLDDVLAMGDVVREPEITDGTSLLFLWSPNAFVVGGEAARVAAAWGYVPKQLIPWVKTDASGKPRLGGGHYTRVCTEQLLLCTRGRGAADLIRRRDIAGVIISPRTAHSAKPDESYRMVEALADGPYLELFARRRWSPAWAVWGNQAPAERAT